MPHYSSANALALTTAKLRAAGCVFAEEEATLLIGAAKSAVELDYMIGQRAGGLPIEHILGWAEFCGRRIEVDPGVFVPRRRSEFLVAQAISLGRAGSVVVDLCCGSGALGLVVAARLTGSELHAADIDSIAVHCARRNLEPVGGKVYGGDLFDPLPEALKGRVDILIANTPYVPTAAIELLPGEARLHEPRIALDGGVDGLDVQRRVAAQASVWLAPGGHLLVETSEGQAATAAVIFEQQGLKALIVGSEEFEATVVIITNIG